MEPLEMIILLTGIFTASGISLWVALLSNKNIHKQQNAQWLYNLHRDFYSDKTVFEEIKISIITISGSNDEISKYMKSVNDLDSDVKFMAYCNFFELMTIFEKNGNIDEKLLEDMFGYFFDFFYHPDVQEYLRKYGYENLLKYIKKYPKSS